MSRYRVRALAEVVVEAEPKEGATLEGAIAESRQEAQALMEEAGLGDFDHPQGRIRLTVTATGEEVTP